LPTKDWCLGGPPEPSGKKILAKGASGSASREVKCRKKEITTDFGRKKWEKVKRAPGFKGRD